MQSPIVDFDVFVVKTSDLGDEGAINSSDKTCLSITLYTPLHRQTDRRAPLAIEIQIIMANLNSNFIVPASSKLHRQHHHHHILSSIAIVPPYGSNE